MVWNRADLVLQARKYGISDDDIDRMSVHALKIEVEACIRKKAEETKRKQIEIEKNRRRQERKDLKQREEQEQRKREKQEQNETIEKQQAEIPPQTTIGGDQSDASDTETVIDMSFATDALNPSDQKFARFQFLVKTRTELLSSLSSNEILVENMKNELDNDDLALLHKCLEHDSQCLAQIKLELDGICVWFEESLAEKQALYRELCGKLVGPSAARVRKHFASKVTKMEENMETIRRQSVEDQKETLAF